MQSANAATAPAAGWFNDPHAPNVMRWWDGFQWTHHVHPPAPAAAPTPGAMANGLAATPSAVSNGFAATTGAATNGFAATAGMAAHATAASPITTHHAYAPVHATSSTATATPAQQAGLTLGAPATQSSLIEDNPKSMTAIGFSLAYLVIAITTGVVLAGIVPALYTFKAFGRGEKLAPVALLTAVAAIAFAFTHMQTR